MDKSRLIHVTSELIIVGGSICFLLSKINDLKKDNEDFKEKLLYHEKILSIQRQHIIDMNNKINNLCKTHPMTSYDNKSNNANTKKVDNKNNKNNKYTVTPKSSQNNKIQSSSYLRSLNKQNTDNVSQQNSHKSSDYSSDGSSDYNSDRSRNHDSDGSSERYFNNYDDLDKELQNELSELDDVSGEVFFVDNNNGVVKNLMKAMISSIDNNGSLNQFQINANSLACDNIEVGKINEIDEDSIIQSDIIATSNHSLTNSNDNSNNNSNNNHNDNHNDNSNNLNDDREESLEFITIPKSKSTDKSKSTNKSKSTVKPKSTNKSRST